MAFRGGIRVLASRYARALLELALERNVDGVIRHDMEQIMKIFEESPEVKAFLKNPVIQQSRKEAMVERVIGAFVSELTTSFLKKVVTRGRAEIIPLIAEEYIREYLRHHGILRVRVRLAFPPPENGPFINQLKQRIAEIFRHAPDRIEMELEEDPSIIGGVLIQTEDKTLDLTVRSQLGRLATTFEEKVQQFVARI